MCGRGLGCPFFSRVVSGVSCLPCRSAVAFFSSVLVFPLFCSRCQLKWTLICACSSQNGKVVSRMGLPYVLLGAVPFVVTGIFTSEECPLWWVPRGVSGVVFGLWSFFRRLVGADVFVDGDVAEGLASSPSC